MGLLFLLDPSETRQKSLTKTLEIPNILPQLSIHGASSPPDPPPAHGPAHAAPKRPIGNLHASSRRRSAAARNPNPRRRDRTAGDERGGTGDGGDARAGVLRAVRNPRRHEARPRGGPGVDPEEQGVPQGRPEDSCRRRCELAQRPAPEGTRFVRLARQLLQPPRTADAPRERRHRRHQGEHRGRVLWSGARGRPWRR